MFRKTITTNLRNFISTISHYFLPSGNTVSPLANFLKRSVTDTVKIIRMLNVPSLPSLGLKVNICWQFDEATHTHTTKTHAHYGRKIKVFLAQRFHWKPKHLDQVNDTENIRYIVEMIAFPSAQKWETFMVRDIITGHQHVVFHAYNNAIAGAFGGRRIEMEQNRFGHSIKFIFLGIHIDTSAGRLLQRQDRWSTCNIFGCHLLVAHHILDAKHIDGRPKVMGVFDSVFGLRSHHKRCMPRCSFSQHD